MIGNFMMMNVRKGNEESFRSSKIIRLRESTCDCTVNQPVVIHTDRTPSIPSDFAQNVPGTVAYRRQSNPLRILCHIDTTIPNSVARLFRAHVPRRGMHRVAHPPRGRLPPPTRLVFATT